MSEVMERETLPEGQPESTPTVPVTDKASGKPLGGKWKAMPRKKRRRIIRWGVILLVLLVIGCILYKTLGGKKASTEQVVTDTVQYGAITSTVEGSGLTKAKTSETITLTTAGTVQDVLVTEGQKVTAGDPLFVIESEAARTAADKARKDVEGYEKKLNTLRKDIAGLNLAAGYPGKLMEVVTLNPGDTITKDSESEIFTVEQSLEDARKTLETAQKNLDNCNAVAPIDGTVIGLMLQQGQEVAANTAVITIADTSTITVDATVDERNVSYVKPGMTVTIDQWGTQFMGTVETVSLNSKAENGVASYPMIITVDNTDGSLMTGSYINYSLAASENDNCLLLPIQCVKTVPLPDGTTGSVVFVKGSRPDNAVDLEVPVDGVPKDFWAVPVEIGISDDYNVEIKSGVEEGAEVFTQVQTESSWM
ncbi:efflux RND transporter periplasmic adaptor subunit [Oscillibacter sp.]|uniref:efflux RND transporter periplasmic adaptor subunit n=1 Tax=Oscillibacter sp. TaxID=1945593 RepID=UPI00262AD59B|nr:efflux RND transporter periplasmic adaptor subunit [Oscillibacter sp.]MDD3347237.1 efflux RND transporter periplasmic adaptor subunit [Oscillibacter sp.]